MNQVNKLPEDINWGLLSALALNSMSREYISGNYDVSPRLLDDYMSGLYTCPRFGLGCEMLKMMVEHFPDKIKAVTGSDSIPVLPVDVDWSVLPEMIKRAYPPRGLNSLLSKRQSGYYDTLSRDRGSSGYRPSYQRGAEIINWVRMILTADDLANFWKEKPKYRYLKVA